MACGREAFGREAFGQDAFGRGHLAEGIWPRAFGRQNINVFDRKTWSRIYLPTTVSYGCNFFIVPAREDFVFKKSFENCQWILLSHFLHF